MLGVPVMADKIDRAQEREQLDRERAIAAARARQPMLACGQCHNCLDAVPLGALFCDADCRDDWTVRRNAEVRRAI